MSDKITQSTPPQPPPEKPIQIQTYKTNSNIRRDNKQTNYKILSEQNIQIPPNTSIKVVINYNHQYKYKPRMSYELQVNSDNEFGIEHHYGQMTPNFCTIHILNKLAMTREVTIIYHVSQN